jgi:hypothetical protein
MHRISRRMVAVLVVIGAIAAGGAAFTASNTIQDSVAGYGTSNITGAVATDVHYTLNGDGTQITTALITFTGDLSHDTVQAGFGSDALTTCSAPVFGTVSSTTTCSGYTQDTTLSATFNVAVTNN